MKTYSDEWVLTDPDTNQHGRQLSETKFEFYEGMGFDPTPIDLDDYKDGVIEYIISAYGYSLYPGPEYIRDLYPDNYNWIIAECIFESENADYI